MKENYTYTHKKPEAVKENIESVCVCFQNGDYISLGKNELKEVSLALADDLVYSNNRMCFHVYKGYLKFKVSIHKSSKYESVFLYRMNDYKNDRKDYIEKRCIRDSMEKILLYDENNWSNTYFGDISARLECGYLYIEFAKSGSCKSDSASISLGAILKKNIRSIDLDFENCDVISIYQDEIKDIRLTFSNELTLSGHDLVRKVESGYIKLKLQKGFNHGTDIYDSSQALTERLVKGDGEEEHDICRLYVCYYHMIGMTECLEICDIRYLDNTDGVDGDGRDDDDSAYAGGYAKKLKKGEIVLTFGKNSKELLDGFIDKQKD